MAVFCFLRLTLCFTQYIFSLQHTNKINLLANEKPNQTPKTTLPPTPPPQKTTTTKNQTTPKHSILEGNVLFNDTLNTFYLLTYGKGPFR